MATKGLAFSPAVSLLSPFLYISGFYGFAAYIDHSRWGDRVSKQVSGSMHGLAVEGQDEMPTCWRVECLSCQMMDMVFVSGGWFRAGGWDMEKAGKNRQ